MKKVKNQNENKIIEFFNSLYRAVKQIRNLWEGELQVSERHTAIQGRMNNNNYL